MPGYESTVYVLLFHNTIPHQHAHSTSTTTPSQLQVHPHRGERAHHYRPYFHTVQMIDVFFMTTHQSILFGD